MLVKHILLVLTLYVCMLDLSLGSFAPTTSVGMLSDEMPWINEYHIQTVAVADTRNVAYETGTEAFSYSPRATHLLYVVHVVFVDTLFHKDAANTVASCANDHLNNNAPTTVFVGRPSLYAPSNAHNNNTVLRLFTYRFESPTLLNMCGPWARPVVTDGTHNYKYRQLVCPYTEPGSAGSINPTVVIQLRAPSHTDPGYGHNAHFVSQCNNFESCPDTCDPGMMTQHGAVTNTGLGVGMSPNAFVAVPTGSFSGRSYYTFLENRTTPGQLINTGANTIGYVTSVAFVAWQFVHVVICITVPQSEIYHLRNIVSMWGEPYAPRIDTPITQSAESDVAQIVPPGYDFVPATAHMTEYVFVPEIKPHNFFAVTNALKLLNVDTTLLDRYIAGAGLSAVDALGPPTDGGTVLPAGYLSLFGIGTQLADFEQITVCSGGINVADISTTAEFDLNVVCDVPSVPPHQASVTVKIEPSASSTLVQYGGRLPSHVFAVKHDELIASTVGFKYGILEERTTTPTTTGSTTGSTTGTTTGTTTGSTTGTTTMTTPTTQFTGCKGTHAWLNKHLVDTAVERNETTGEPIVVTMVTVELVRRCELVTPALPFVCNTLPFSFSEWTKTPAQVNDGTSSTHTQVYDYEFYRLSFNLTSLDDPFVLSLSCNTDESTDGWQITPYSVDIPSALMIARVGAGSTKDDVGAIVQYTATETAGANNLQELDALFVQQLYTHIPSSEACYARLWRPLDWIVQVTNTTRLEWFDFIQSTETTDTLTECHRILAHEQLNTLRIMAALDDNSGLTGVYTPSPLGLDLPYIPPQGVRVSVYTFGIVFDMYIIAHNVSNQTHAHSRQTRNIPYNAPFHRVSRDKVEWIDPSTWYIIFGIVSVAGCIIVAVVHTIHKYIQRTAV